MTWLVSRSLSSLQTSAFLIWNSRASSFLSGFPWWPVTHDAVVVSEVKWLLCWLFGNWSPAAIDMLWGSREGCLGCLTASFPAQQGLGSYSSVTLSKVADWDSPGRLLQRCCWSQPSRADWCCAAASPCQCATQRRPYVLCHCRGWRETKPRTKTKKIVKPVSSVIFRTYFLFQNVNGVEEKVSILKLRFKKCLHILFVADKNLL